MNKYKNIICYLLKHKYEIYKLRPYAQLVHCKRCNKRWVMDMVHEIFLRYDNDIKFWKNLKLIYPELNEQEALND